MIHALRRLPPFVKFALVGIVGLGIDSAVLMLALHGFGLDPYSARLFSFFVAVTGTWIGNRNITFHDRQQKTLFREWLAFVAANGTGGFINYGVYSLLVAFVPTVAQTPLWGVAAGSLTAMMFNYVASARLVFRKS